MIKMKDVCIIIPSLDPDTRLSGVVQSIMAEGFSDIILVDDGHQLFQTVILGFGGIQVAQLFIIELGHAEDADIGCGNNSQEDQHQAGTEIYALLLVHVYTLPGIWIFCLYAIS